MDCIAQSTRPRASGPSTRLDSNPLSNPIENMRFEERLLAIAGHGTAVFVHPAHRLNSGVLPYRVRYPRFPTPAAPCWERYARRQLELDQVVAELGHDEF